LTVVSEGNLINHHDVTRKLTGNYGVSIVTVVTRTHHNVTCMYIACFVHSATISVFSRGG